MTVDFDRFTPAERDNFVRMVLSEKEIEAIVIAATGRGRIPKPAEELLELCFQAAVNKMKRLHGRIAEKRGAKP